MPWRPLPRIAFAVAIYPFQPSSPADLPLELGDELYIIEQGGTDGGWYRGYLVAPPSLLAGLTSVKGQTLEARVFSGIFPRCCVEVREVLGDGRTKRQSRANESEHDGLEDNNVNGGYIFDHEPLGQTSSARGSAPGNGTLKGGEFSKRTGNSQEPGPDNFPSRSLSQRTHGPHSRALGRKLSHQSITSRGSRSSVLFPNSKTARPPGVKRSPAPVPMLKIGDETPTSSSEPLVDEIASALREWHSKNLHELLLSRRYSVLEKVSQLVDQLDFSRRQLLRGVLTAQELETLREQVVWELVRGNKMLSGEVIVRDPRQRGRLLTGDDSALELTRLQSSMSLLDRQSLPPNDSIDLHHLMVELKSCGHHILNSPTMTATLCSRNQAESPKSLTETFLLDLPPQDEFDKVAASGTLRTLFTDLTPADIGEKSGFETQIFLVINVYADQLTQSPSLTVPSSSSLRSKTSAGRPTTGTSPGTAVKKGSGRASMMWRGSTRSRDQPEPSVSQVPSISESSTSLEGTGRPSLQESLRPLTQQGPHHVKRRIGVGIANVKQLLGQNRGTEQVISIWSTASTGTEAQDAKNPIDQLVYDLLGSQSGRIAKSRGIDHIRLAMHPFTGPDASILINNTPTLLQNISRTPKLGFSGAPTKARSDIYLTLSEAFLPAQALLSHPERGTVAVSPSLALRNVQLTLEVRRKSGERIENCIFPSSNNISQTAWRTCAAERGEPWNQTVKLVIPNDDVPEAHLIMSVADAPGFPFALSYIPLWDQDAFIRDGPHAPLLYLYDKLTSSADKGRGAYLAFPWSSRAKDDTSKDETLTGPVATLKLETYLCSTVFSQDKVLLGIFKWREQSASQLLDLLRRFVFVPEIEIVKLVNEVFDALFGILIENAGKDEYEDLVFYALVTVLGIVHDRRFNLGPLVDQYAETRFDYPFATPCLVRSYLRLLAKPSDPQNSRRLRATFKVGRQILKFIISAREKQKIREASIGTTTQTTFIRDVKRIFAALEALIKNPTPTLVGSKTLIVQHIHTWLPELVGTFSEDEILQIAFGFLDSCAAVQGKLILYKLVLILSLSKMTIFADPSVRNRIASRTAQWIDPYWGINDNNSDQWREQARLCCSIAVLQIEKPLFEVSEYFVKIVQSYHSIKEFSRSSDNSLSLLFPTMYPFSSKPISNSPDFDEALTELAALFAQLAGKPIAQGLNQSSSDLAEILDAALEVIISILSGAAFPKSWLSLHVYHHKSSLQILESLYGVIVAKFLPALEVADDFNTELWSKYFLALLTLLRSTTLALETFPEQKRRAVWKIAGDVREQGASLLRRSWDAIGWDSNPEEEKRFGVTRLGGFQVQYVPKLVAPIMELCLSVHEGLRGAAVRILHTMMVSEWTLSEDLSIIQAEIIECLDLMFKRKSVGEGISQKLFVNELLGLFESLAQSPDDPLWCAVESLVSTVDELLDLLAAVHSTDITETFRIWHTLQLMDFLKDMQKEDIFIRYVHQLAQIQIRLHNPTEAALALRLHADLYEWDSKRVRSLEDPSFFQQTSFERREQLYFDMIKYFEEGMAWSCALASYRELADQYEHHHYDYPKLARTQRAMAKIYETISKSEWHAPRYYRVIYRGLGFPSSLRDKQFIFEAASSERHSVFADRMRQQHPSAQIASSNDTYDLEGQYLQIFPVSPHRETRHPIYQQSKVNQSVREHVLSAQPNRFAITSRRHSPSSGVKDQWIEKTIYTTAASFPTIMRKSEVIAVDVVRLSPLQTAVERTTRKTTELSALAKRINDGDESILSNLTDAINSSVDPASPTSVAQYRELIHTAKEGSDDEEQREESSIEPLETALQLALLDHTSTLRYCLSMYSRPAYLNTQKALMENLQVTFGPELVALEPQQPHTPPKLQLPISPPQSPSQVFSSALPTSPTLPNGNQTSKPSIPQTAPSTDSRTRSHLSLSFLKATPIPNGSSPHPSSMGDDSASSLSNRSGVVAGSEDGSMTRKIGAEEVERPVTAHSGRSASMRKRLSVLGIGKSNKGSVKNHDGKAIVEVVEE